MSFVKHLVRPGQSRERRTFRDPGRSCEGSTGMHARGPSAPLRSPEARSKRQREHSEVAKPTVPLAMCDPRFLGTCGSAGADTPVSNTTAPSGRGPDVMQAYAASGSACGRAAASQRNGLAAAAAAGSMAPPSGGAAAGAGSEQAPAPGEQGVVGALAPPPASDHNLYSKWAMMLQQQLEQAYLERSRVLQLAIKLQVENLHLKEALYSENSQRFMQLVQVRRLSVLRVRAVCMRSGLSGRSSSAEWRCGARLRGCGAQRGPSAQQGGRSACQGDRRQRPEGGRRGPGASARRRSARCLFHPTPAAVLRAPPMPHAPAAPRCVHPLRAQLGTIAAGALIDGSGMELPTPPLLPLGVPPVQPPPRAAQPPLSADGGMAMSVAAAASALQQRSTVGAAGGSSSSGVEGVAGSALMRVMSAGGTVALAASAPPLASRPPAAPVTTAGGLEAAAANSAAAAAAVRAAAETAAAKTASAEAANMNVMSLFMTDANGSGGGGANGANGLGGGGAGGAEGSAAEGGEQTDTGADDLDLSTENLQILAKYFDQGEAGGGSGDAGKGDGGDGAADAQGNESAGGARPSPPLPSHRGRLWLSSPVSLVTLLRVWLPLARVLARGVPGVCLPSTPSYVRSRRAFSSPLGVDRCRCGPPPPGLRACAQAASMRLRLTSDEARVQRVASRLIHSLSETVRS